MDELTAPLGQSRAPPRRFRVARSIAVGLGVLALAGVGLWFVGPKGLFHDKRTAAAPAPRPIEAQAPLAGPAAAAGPTGSVRGSTAAAAPRTVTIIDGISGKRQEVVIGSPDPAPRAAPGQRSR
jgi:hypothetical protein